MNPALAPIRAEMGFWLILIAGLAACVGFETDWGRQTEWPLRPTAEAPPILAKPALTEPFRLPGSDQFPDISLRPLFIITRSPVPPAPSADSKTSMKKDQFVLVGTTIVTEGRFAFLLEKAGNRSRVVAEGKEINGIMVREVSADRVVLSQNADTEVLLLKTNKLPAGTLTPIPATLPVGPPPTAVRRVELPPAVRPGATQPMPTPSPPRPSSVIGPR